MSKKAPSPIIIGRSEPIPISPKTLHTPIISQSAPGSYYDFFVGSPRSGEILDLYKSNKLLTKLSLAIGEKNPIDEDIDQSLLVGEKSEEE
ncbi:MAG: hypothetical protein K9G65_00925 [Rickettsiaceae bacterium]|jgi:hypothetical protein|nr:hypothetical protein [Rickettsiaceae bacterium]